MFPVIHGGLSRPGAGIMLCVVVGCADPGPDPTIGTKIRMDWEAEEFWASPWPGVDRRARPGGPIAGFRNPDAVPFVERLIAAGADLEGEGTTSGVFFPLEGPADPRSLPSLRGSLDLGASAFLVGIEPGSPDFGVRIPVIADLHADGGPFGAPNFLALIPLQGRPLRPQEHYAAVVTRGLLDPAGHPFGHAPSLDAPSGELSAALQTLDTLGTPPDEVVGLSVLLTHDPTAQLTRWLDHARGEVSPIGPFVPGFSFPDYCVAEARVQMPVYQGGDPPYDDGGGAFVDEEGPVLQRQEEARVWVTVPRGAAPPEGWPVVVFARTGGGGDRPLIDRGPHDASRASEPGSGYARDFAAAGWAGVMVDGPLGGLRNPTGGDEQFLIFNVLNPAAMRDNIRQSALELALLPSLLDGITVPGCEGETTLDTGSLGLFGHSMGATIAPLTLGLEPRYDLAILSGAGGSWIHNIVHKLSPLEVRPIAEAMLRYPGYGVELHEADPVLSLLQWVGESADPPAWAGAVRANAPTTLVVQGIVDTYILPPMANTTSLSLGLDLVGAPLDALEPRLEAFATLEELLDLGAGGVRVIDDGPSDHAVIQLAEDGIEDGHEVIFQRPDARARIRELLASWRSDAR